MIAPRVFRTGGPRYSHDPVSDADFERALTAAVFEDANVNAVPFPSSTALRSTAG